MERINRILARAGVASRRGADRLIEEGRVRVNGHVVSQLGARADVAVDVIKVDGKRIDGSPRTPSYRMLHKPGGYVTTASDPEGRRTVLELIPKKPRLFPVGRLDYHSEGLLLLTDDGELARDLMHPSSHVSKTYHAKVRGVPSDDALDRIRRGVPLDGRRTLPAEARVIRRGRHTWIEIVITEGRRRQIRRMFQAVGHPVIKLKRVGYGDLRLGELRPGTWRDLRPREVERLRAAVAAADGRRARRP